MRQRYSKDHMPLYLFSSIRKRWYSTTVSKGARHIPVYMLVFVTKGEGSLLANGSLQQVKPFELYFFVPGMTIEVSVEAAPIEYYVIIFKPIEIITTDRKLAISGHSSFPKALLPGRLPLRNTHQAFQRILQLYEDNAERHSTHAFALRLQLETLIYSLLWDLTLVEENRDSRIETSIAHMQKHLAHRIQLDNLAQVAGLSPAAFSRIFRKKTGLLPIEYLTRMRIAEAKKLLAQEDSRVKEVSAAVGFRSEFYFSRTFQRIVNVSPKIYMNRRKLKIAIASSLGFHDHLSAIGVETVANIDLYKYPWMMDGEYQLLLHDQLLKLADSNPDLIIGDHYHQSFQNHFKKLAPHVILHSHDRNWRRNYLNLAELVDRERDANQEINRLELRIAEVRRTLNRSFGDQRIAILQVTHETVGIQGTANHPLNELMHSELGLKPGKWVPADNWRLELPPESLPHLETEHLFVQKHHLLAGSEKVFDRMTNTPSWNDIPAVKNNRVHLIPNWFLMSWTPQGRNQIVDALLSMK
jgi:AraC-like DNA-binding protein/ABC-type enterochelin transport system substrate-binding protein